jgi:hypothetical protein
MDVQIAETFTLTPYLQLTEEELSSAAGLLTVHAHLDTSLFMPVPKEHCLLINEEIWCSQFASLYNSLNVAQNYVYRVSAGIFTFLQGEGP